MTTLVKDNRGGEWPVAVNTLRFQQIYDAHGVWLNRFLTEEDRARVEAFATDFVLVFHVFALLVDQERVTRSISLDELSNRMDGPALMEASQAILCEITSFLSRREPSLVRAEMAAAVARAESAGTPAESSGNAGALPA